MKTTRDYVNIIDAYQELGSYRAAAELCGITHKTVRRAIERQEAGGPWVRRPRVLRRNTDAVASVITQRVKDTNGRITAKRLLPAARAAGYQGSARNFRRALAAARADWRRKRRSYRPWVPSPGQHLQGSGRVQGPTLLSAPGHLRLPGWVGMDPGARALPAHWSRFCVETDDRRPRAGSTIAELAEQEQLLAIPTSPYPVTVAVQREVGDSSLVRFRGNQYSINPGLEGVSVCVRHRVGSQVLEIVSAAGRLLATHARQPNGAGVIQRLPEHRAALEKVVLANFSSARPCPRKVNRPPSTEALAAAARLREHTGADVVIDLGRYAELMEGTR